MTPLSGQGRQEELTDLCWLTSLQEVCEDDGGNEKKKKNEEEIIERPKTSFSLRTACSSSDQITQDFAFQTHCIFFTISLQSQVFVSHPTSETLSHDAACRNERACNRFFSSLRRCVIPQSHSGGYFRVFSPRDPTQHTL